jgi:Tetratricopeptide repeat
MFKNYYILLSIIFFVLTAPMYPQTEATCDSLIKKGIHAADRRDYSKALEYFTKANAIAEKMQWDNESFWAKNDIGAIYYAMMDYDEALNYLFDAYKLAVKASDPKKEMAVLNNISMLYTKDKNYEKANEFLLKAYDIAVKSKNKKNISTFALNLANNANLREQPLKAQAYVEEALKNTNDPKIAHFCEMMLAESEFLLDHTLNARKKAQDLYGRINKLEMEEIGDQLKLIIIKSYLKEENFPQAKKVALEVLAAKPDIEIKQEAFEHLVEANSKEKNYQAVSDYKDSIINLERKGYELRSGRQYENNRVKFEIENYKYEIRSSEQKLKDERKLFYALIVIIIAVLVIVILLFRNRSIRFKQRELLAEQKQHILILELEQQKEEQANALLEEQRLRDEIELRNRELSSKELYISGRNQLIEEVVQLISQNATLDEDPEIAAHIRSLKGHLASNNDWENFVVHFEQVNNGLLKRLQERHPLLSSNDIRFIAYIYMNLSIKEIATILNITPIACGKRKERIVAKLDIPKNTSLYSYLSSI